MSTRQIKIWVILAFFCFLMSGAAQAKLEDRVTSPKLLVRAPARLFQGIENFSFGWTSVLIEPVKAARTKDDHVGNGIFRGFGNAISYTCLGVWDAATFWVPGPGYLGTDISKVTENVFDL